MSNNNNKIKEPLFHIAKRDALPFWQSWLIRILSIVASLIVCSIVTIVLTGENPIGVFTTLIEGAIGSERRIWSLMQNVAILLCISLAVTPAFKMKFWNIGAEGQVLIGGLATAACMIYFGQTLPPILLFPVMIIASVAAGAIWAVIPAFFKAHWNTNETLFTLMMNYIAMQIVSYFVFIHSNPVGSGKIGIINPDSMAGWLPKIGGKNYLFNIIIVAVLTVGMYIYLKYNKHGYEISVVGESENTAKYVGINVKKVIIRTLLLSGAVCGIAGFLLVSGTDHSIAKETVDSRGFTAIMVSWLAKFNPIYMILTSLLIVFLEKGAAQISTDFDLNDSFSEILTGIIIFFIIGSEFFVNYTIKFRQKEKEANK